MTLAGVAIVLAAFAVFAALGAVLWAAGRGLRHSLKEQIETAWRAASRDFLELAAERLHTERAQQVGELDLRKQQIEQTVDGLEQQLARCEQMIHEFEGERATKYGRLEQQLTATAAETQRLQQTTAQLASMLGNAKVRGQWGERTAEDILRLCGLQEGVQYQKQQDAALGRPDFTFLLPDGQQFYMDVKFPLDNYIRCVNATREEEQRSAREQFLRDVRVHMRELERRAYAPSGAGSPDYVLMFIPNEQVYSAVNEWMPTILDEALKKRIILCGPSSLYAQVRVIWQAWQSYHYSLAVQDIVRVIHAFAQDYQKFKERFQDLGTQIQRTSDKYQELLAISFRRLEQRMQKIADYQRGQQGLEPPLAQEEKQAGTASESPACVPQQLTGVEDTG